MNQTGRDAELLWRATVYVCVAQLHLRANPMLTTPLRVEHLEPRPSGHWGTVPGNAWALAHLALVRRKPGAEIVPVVGAGHAGVVQIGLAWLTEGLAGVRPQFGRDEKGLTRLVRSFPDVDGLGSETHPQLPAGAYVGGCLGGALAFAQGAAAATTGRVVVPILGDGECETPTTAAAWLAQRELPPSSVLPIVHLNGFRMGARALLSRLSDDELRAYATGLGWDATIFSVGDGGVDEHSAFAELLQRTVRECADGCRRMLILRCVKGWSGPPAVGGRELLGTERLHKTPLADPGLSAKRVRRLLADWLSSYRPRELFQPSGALTEPLTRVADSARFDALTVCPSGDRGHLADAPTVDSFASAVTSILTRHAAEEDFRVFSPDELSSNRLESITGRSWTTEVLAEEVLLGWLAGWTAGGRRGLLISYEAFAPLLTSWLIAHLKQRHLTAGCSSRPSLTLLLTSYGWHNVYSHADPSLSTALLASRDSAVRVFTPADPTRLAKTLDDALWSRGRVNLVIAGKHATDRPSPRPVPEEIERGLAIWTDLSDPEEPDLTVVCAGDLPCAVARSALPRVRQHHPGTRVRTVGVLDLTVLGDPLTWPAGLTDLEVDHYLGVRAAVLILTLGHPAAIWGLLAGRLRRPVEVIGWREPHRPMTQPDLASFCGLDESGVLAAAVRLLNERTQEAAL